MIRIKVREDGDGYVAECGGEYKGSSPDEALGHAIQTAAQPQVANGMIELEVPEAPWHCQNCGEEGTEDDFIPSDGSEQVVDHACPKCGSATEVFPKN